MKVKQLWKLYSITTKNMLTFADGFETKVAKNKKVIQLSRLCSSTSKIVLIFALENKNNNPHIS